MAFDKAMAHLKAKGFGDRVIVPQEETATVEEAAAALGTAPAQIAKTMAFDVDGAAVLVLCAGDARVNSSKFKKYFHGKPHMIPSAAVEEAVGHAPGGVCPFGINEDVAVYLDESLKRFDTVYPACGDDHSGVALSVSELEAASDAQGWVDVCRGWELPTA